MMSPNPRQPVPEGVTLPSPRIHDWSGDEEMSLTPTEEDLESSEALRDLYSRWCCHHKILRTPEEMNQRFQTFRRNVVHVFELNKMFPSWKFYLSSCCDGKDLFDWSGDEEMSLTPTEEDLESGKALRDLYSRWCCHHKILRTPEEMNQRFRTFRQNVVHVFELNQALPALKFYLSSCCDSKDLFDWSVDEQMSLTPTEKDLESDEAMRDLYSRWCCHHKILRTPEEMNQRFKTFRQNVAHVFELNEMFPSWKFYLSSCCDGKDLFENSRFYDELFLIPTERDLESDEAVLDLYYRWCVRHLIRRTPKEMQRRFKNFKKNAFHVFKINQKDPSGQICLSIWCDRIDLRDRPVDEEMTVTPTGKDLESDEALGALYSRWRSHHMISRTPEEIHHMFEDFRNSAIHVFEMNQKDPSCQFCLSFGCDERDEFVYETRVIPTERDLKSGNALLNLYHRYCNFYSHPMKLHKLTIFKKSVIRVYEMNQRESSCKFYLSPYCEEEGMLDQGEDAAWEVKIRPHWRDLKSKEAVWDLYHRWCVYYKIRRTPEEMEKRFDTFEKRARRNFELNLEKPGSFVMSQFADDAAGPGRGVLPHWGKSHLS